MIPGSERSPGEGKGYPLQYSGLENSMDCIVHGVTESRTRLSNFHFTSLSERPAASPPILPMKVTKLNLLAHSFSFFFLQGKFILFLLSTKRILRMSMVVIVKHFHFKMGNDIFFLKAIHKNNYNTFIHRRTISAQPQVSPGERVCIWCPSPWIGHCFFLQYWLILTFGVHPSVNCQGQGCGVL